MGGEEFGDVRSGDEPERNADDAVEDQGDLPMSQSRVNAPVASTPLLSSSSHPFALLFMRPTNLSLSLCLSPMRPHVPIQVFSANASDAHCQHSVLDTWGEQDRLSQGTEMSRIPDY